MPASRKLYIAVITAALVGVTLFIALLLRSSIHEVSSAIRAAGRAIAIVVAFHIVPLATNTLAWWVLFPREKRLPYRSLLWIRWIGESVSALMPATTVGGEFVRARLAGKRCVGYSESTATVIADMTLGIGSQIIFTLAGLFFLTRLTGRGDFARQGIVGAAIAIGAVGGFLAVQRFGIFRIARGLMSTFFKTDGGSALRVQGEALDRELRAIYARRRSIATSFGWSLVTWVAGAGEVWLSLWALGLPMGFEHAFVLESTCQGVRAVMFLIPGALGVQEGGFVVVGGMLGIPAETAMALALLRRARELAFGIPGLIAWQLIEGRWLLRASVQPLDNADLASGAPDATASSPQRASALRS